MQDGGSDRHHTTLIEHQFERPGPRCPRPSASTDESAIDEGWEITDPRLAVRVDAVVGGTPADRREFVRDDVPHGLDDFDSWVTRTVLDPARPLFREARYLLAEEPGTRDLSLYHSTLAAVAEGNTTRGGIANYIGRKAADLATR